MATKDAKTVTAADMGAIERAPELPPPSVPAFAAPTIVPDADAELAVLAELPAGKVVVKRRLQGFVRHKDRES